MRITGCENPIGHDEIRSLLQRREQLCRGVVEPTIVKESLANPGQIVCQPIAGAQAQKPLEMLQRQIGLAGKKPNQTAQIPTASKTRIESETAVDQLHCDINVLAIVPEHQSNDSKDAGVVGAALERLSGKLDTCVPITLRLCRPAVYLEQVVTSGR